jgi:hypothetical protein
MTDVDFHIAIECKLPRWHGFNSPMPGWMNGPLVPWVDQLLCTDDTVFAALVDVPALRRKVQQLTDEQAWDLRSVGRLWPYIHLKWYLDEVIRKPFPQHVEH